MKIKIFCCRSLFPSWSPKDLSAPLYYYYYRGAGKSLARPTSRCILFDGKNISFDASLVIYINSTNIPPIMIINRIYENKNLLSLYLVSFLVGLRTYQHPCNKELSTLLQKESECFLQAESLISLHINLLFTFSILKY